MKNFLKAGIFFTTSIFSAIVPLAAQATIYDFSYAFADSSVVSGSLSGNLNGSYIDNVSNVHVFLNGTEFSGSLFNAAWNTTTHDWDNTRNAVVSTNAALNNFLFADANVPTDYNLTNYFYFVNDPASLGHEVFANNFNTGALALDNPTNTSWSLVAQVPEPAPYAVFLLGVGIVGLIRIRKAGRA